MKEFLVILFMIFVGLVPEIIKAKKKKNDQKNPRPRPAYEPDEVEFENNIELQKNDENLSKESEYFTFETIEPEVENVKKQVKKSSENTSQVIENEVENNVNLTFDKEEMAKGIIYSEILKRKYN